MRKTIIILMLYLILFLIMFIVGIYEFFKKGRIIDLGLSSNVTNLILIGFSIIGIIKTIWHLYTY